MEPSLAMDSSRPVLEVCIASLEDAVAAEAGGADRLELNVALELGGLTPSSGLLAEIKSCVALPVIAMLRPRAAGFCYSPSDQRVLLRDAEILLEQGADGVAAGCLLPDGRLDLPFWRQLLRRTEGRPAVFHRAFDCLSEPLVALHQLAVLGTRRILTSGSAATALAGRAQIAQLQKAAGEKIEILPGAGVTAENVAELLQSTGCRQVHGTFRTEHRDRSGPVSGDTYLRTSRAKVAAMRAVLNALPRPSAE